MAISKSTKMNTVEPGDSKLQALVNFLLLTKISNYSIDHMIDSKNLAIVNIFALTTVMLSQCYTPSKEKRHFL